MKVFTPYPHQKAGVDWILDLPACALFWGMGTGKTVTTLTALALLLYDFLEEGPALIIAPKRVAEDTWSKEAAKWEHLQHLRVVKVMGTAKQRAAALDTPADLYVINRENVVWLVEFLGNRWPFKIVVLDELSSFKSAQAKRWKALRRVRGRIRRVIGLTGTPRPNGLEDLWPEIYLLDQGARLGRTLGQFRAKYLTPDKMSGHIVYSYKPRQGAEAEVYDKLADLCMSIRKEDVLSLPGQIYEDIELTPPADLLKQYNVRLVLQGHQHIHEEIQERGRWFVTGGGICASWWSGPLADTEEGYVLVHVGDNGDLSWEYIDYGWDAVRK